MSKLDRMKKELLKREVPLAEIPSETLKDFLGWSLLADPSYGIRLEDIKFYHYQENDMGHTINHYGLDLLGVFFVFENEPDGQTMVNLIAGYFIHKYKESKRP